MEMFGNPFWPSLLDSLEDWRNGEAVFWFTWWYRNYENGNHIGNVVCEGIAGKVIDALLTSLDELEELDQMIMKEQEDAFIVARDARKDYCQA